MLNILVPHLKRKDILFNHRIEAIAWVHPPSLEGRSTLTTERAEAVAFGKGEVWSTTGIPISRLPEGLSIKPCSKTVRI
jgi:hypothetical protein